MPAAPKAGRPAKLLSSWRTKLQLTAAAAAILGVGGLLAPPPKNSEVPVLEERPNPLLEAQVALPEPVVEPFAGVDEVAPRLQRHTAGVALGAMPSGAAVVVSDGHLLTVEPVADGLDTVRVVGESGGRDAQVVAFDPATSLVLLRSAGSVGPPAVLASETPPPGRLLVATGLLDGQPAVWPAFVVSASPRMLVLSPPPPMAGAPVFTLDGALVGLTTDASTGLALRAASPVVDGLLAQAGRGELDQAFGVTLQRIDDGLARPFGQGGILVADVVADGPADLAGLRAGDVVVTLDGQAVPVDQDPETLLEDRRQAVLGIRRAGPDSAVSLDAAPAHRIAALARHARALPAPRADDVLPQDLRLAAGLPPDAGVLAVNGVDRPTADAVRRLLRGGPGVVVLRVRTSEGVRLLAVEVPR